MDDTAPAQASGVGPPREFAAARSELTFAERHLAYRTLRRRQVASDPRVARMVAARARWLMRERSDGRSRRLTLAGFTLFFVALGAIQLAANDSLGAACFFAAALVFGAVLWHARPSVRESLVETERANREVAERAGLVPAADGDLPARPTPRTIAHDSAITWIANDIGFGAISLWFDGRSLTVLGVIKNGAFFATFMTALSLWTIWRQNRNA